SSGRLSAPASISRPSPMVIHRNAMRMEICAPDRWFQNLATLLSDNFVPGIDHGQVAVVTNADRAAQADLAAWLQACNVGPAVEQRGEVPGGVGQLAGEHGT